MTLERPICESWKPIVNIVRLTNEQYKSQSSVPEPVLAHNRLMKYHSSVLSLWCTGSPFRHHRHCSHIAQNTDLGNTDWIQPFYHYNPHAPQRWVLLYGHTLQTAIIDTSAPFRRDSVFHVRNQMLRPSLWQQSVSLWQNDAHCKHCGYCGLSTTMDKRGQSESFMLDHKQELDANCNSILTAPDDI